MKKALIIGINEQDGSYLAKLLLSEEYGVHGILRPALSLTTNFSYASSMIRKFTINIHSRETEIYHELARII